MVWCCGPVEALSPEEHVFNETKNGKGVDFAGQRRQYMPVNGNALIAGITEEIVGHEGEDLVTGKLETTKK
jgi:hypothetical protein